MLNIFSFVCIYIHSVLYSSSFFSAKLPEAYAFLNPIVDYANNTFTLFSLSFCLTSCCKFSMRSLI